MAVAGFRRVLIPDPAPNFQSLAPQWPKLAPAHRYPPSQSRGMITYHPWYHQFRPSIANQCLAEAAELRAGYIRIDIRWKDLIPDGRKVDEAAWDWYQSYLQVAHDWYGLEPVIVLSNPPAAVFQYSLDMRLALWTRYVDEVAHRAGDLCKVYQVLNEPNNPVFRIFPTRNTATAIVSAATAIRRRNPAAKITINILVDLWGWESALTKILQESGSAIDIIGFDYYPGTWTVSTRSDSSNWNRFVDLLVRSRKSSSSSLHRRPVAIMETGYATNLQAFRNENQQVRYLRTLEMAMTRLDAQVGHEGLILMGIHELSDSDTSAFFDPEAHFGLLTSDTLRRKTGFEVARRIFSSLQ
jgi:beta-glucosidase/6-phospho-beta-glucosidase/beta-galactosidase